MIQSTPALRRSASVDPQHFASPRAAILTEPDAIQRETNDGTADSLLRLHHGNVRMMMLDSDRRNTEALGKRKRHVATVHVRMQVMRDRVKRPGRLTQQLLDGTIQRLAGDCICKVAV
jgi:hypothetical protein